jgi:hypothetical protein
MDEDIRSNLKSDDRLNNEAIEKFIALQNELPKHYAFAESAIPTDIFKPNLIKIENTADAEEYFENSVDEYHKPENHSYLEELYSWFENDYKLYSPFLSDKECNQGDYYHVIECIYASKLLKLPYEHICNSFNLREEEEIGFGNPDALGDDPLTDFFYYFYELWYQRGIDTNFKSNREETCRFYDLNRIKQNLS